ncbi:MAG: HAMP domain-containing sensor histidine kinase [Clostridia bacterium]|nr:HAMP domain-containing sensor histidine kinase [Clostridia bacterium]
MALLLGQSYNIEISRAYSRVEDAARDAADEVEYDGNGRLSIDDDIEYYRDSVTVMIIDMNKAMVAGRAPALFDTDTDIELNSMRVTDGWIVLDIVSDEPSLIVRAVYSMNEINANMTRLFITAAILFAGFVCVLTTVSFIIAKYAFWPLYKINDTLNAIKPGKSGQRVELKRAAVEFNELADNINEMIKRVDTSFAMERRFTSDVSHELRTPLGIMMSNLEYALSRPDDHEAAVASIDACQEQTKRMIELVNKLLIIARADSGKMKLNLENVNLSELCDIACEQQREIASDRGIELQSDIEPELFVNGDETMLLVILSNLLENAMKYHRESGDDRFVKLELKRESGRSVMRVTDNGRGIPPEHLDSVWDRFHRIETAKDSKEGSGLGLAIVKHLVIAHGGEYGAQSVPGGLTQFWVAV